MITAQLSRRNPPGKGWRKRRRNEIGRPGGRPILSSGALDAFRGDADGFRRADETAEVAAHAAASEQTRPAGLQVELDGLMSAVVAGGVAAATAYALSVVETREENRVALEPVMRHDGAYGSAYDRPEAAEMLDLQIIAYTLQQVLYDTVAVLHHGRGDLHASCSERDEFESVDPVLDASHSADVHPTELFAVRHIGNEAESDRLDRLTGISSHYGVAVHVGFGGEGVDVNAGDAVYGVYGSDAVRASAPGRHRHRDHIGDVRSHLREHRQSRAPAHGGSELLYEGLVLTDRHSERVGFHIGTGEVAFYHIGSRQFAFVREGGPLLFVLAHYRGYDDLFREIPLQTAEDFHILLDAVVGQLLYVLEAAEGVRMVRDRGETRRCLVLREGADGFERGSGPAGLEGLGAHLVAARHDG